MKWLIEIILGLEFLKTCWFTYGTPYDRIIILVLQTCAYIDYLFVFHPANKGKIYYGLLKEPDINIQIDEDDEGGEGEDKPKVF